MAAHTTRSTAAGLALAGLCFIGLVAVGMSAGDGVLRKPLPDGNRPAALAPPPAPAQSDSADTQRFLAFIAALRRDAEAAGITPGTLDVALNSLLPDPEVIALLGRQPEFVTPPGDYLARLVSDSRVETGRLHLAARALPLVAIESTYGVDRNVLVAIWGIESNYGSVLGERSVIRSLATLASADTRRGSFWRSELLTALAIVERGEATPDRMVGSWAGAMGHTQFMPSTYTRHAVDFDGDGRRDVWGAPLDALASAANYLRVSGWRPDRPWGLEVRLPAGLNLATVPLDQKEPWQAWAALGLAPVATGLRPPLAANEPLQLLLPAGIDGPAFLVTNNFDAILRYNNSTLYALAVGHLADRLAGSEPLARAFPSSDPALAMAERLELQTHLASLGHDIGGADGMIGIRTRAAIRNFQIARGLPADGYASRRLLDELRRQARP